MERRNRRRSFRLLELAFSLVFLVMVAHHVVRQEFTPLVALCAPILILYFGFASLLFVRGRALVEGPWQLRSLLAGERAMQAAIWHLLGVVLGVSAYGLLRYLDVPSDTNLGQAAWLLVFAAPYALMQAGLLAFLRAIWVVAPHLARPVSAFEVRRRVSKSGSPVRRGGEARYSPTPQGADHAQHHPPAPRLQDHPRAPVQGLPRPRGDGQVAAA